MRRRALAGLLLAFPARAQPPGLVPLMGKRLFTPGGEELGRLVDVIADSDGRPVAGVFDIGGFMGVGTRRVALAWELLRFRSEATMVRMSVEIPPERITAAPEYRPGDAASILGPGP